MYFSEETQMTWYEMVIYSETTVVHGTTWWPNAKSCSHLSESHVTSCICQQEADGDKKPFYIAREIMTSEQTFVDMLKLLHHVSR